jgi:hypothetical protein
MKMYVFVTDAAHNQVAFHATDSGLNYLHPSSGTPIIFTGVHYNLGRSYSPTTGYFTAKFAGIYYFIVTTGGFNNNAEAYHFLVMDNNILLGKAYTYKSGRNADYVPFHAVVHLNPGQKVWVQGDGSTYEGGNHSMFTGFLLANDP